MTKWILLFLMAFGGFAGWYYRYRQHHKKPELLTQVNDPVEAPTSLRLDNEPQKPKEEGYLGVVLLGQSLDLAAKADGRLADVLVQVGERVTRGTAIAHVDAPTLHEQLRAAQAARQAAYDMYKNRIPLARSHAVSGEELNQVRSAFDQAAAHVREIEAMINDTTLRAPFNGVVTLRFIEPGALVAPGRAIIRIIGDQKPFVRFAIPEEQRGELVSGTRVKMRLDKIDQEIEGTVTQVSPEVDTTLRMIIGVANLDLPEELRPRLFTGVTTRVRVVETVAEADHG